MLSEDQNGDGQNTEYEETRSVTGDLWEKKSTVVERELFEWTRVQKVLPMFNQSN